MYIYFLNYKFIHLPASLLPLNDGLHVAHAIPELSEPKFVDTAKFNGLSLMKVKLNRPVLNRTKSKKIYTEIYKRLRN